MVRLTPSCCSRRMPLVCVCVFSVKAQTTHTSPVRAESTAKEKRGGGTKTMTQKRGGRENAEIFYAYGVGLLRREVERRKKIGEPVNKPSRAGRRLQLKVPVAVRQP